MRFLGDLGQEVFQDPLARLGEDRFWVKLDSLYAIAAVPDGHDGSVICSGGDLQFRWERGGVDNQGVVSGGLEGGRQAGENSFARMRYQRCLAVHDAVCPHHSGAKGRCDALMAQAHTQERNPSPQGGEQFQGGGGIVWVTRPWGYQDSPGAECFGRCDVDLVASADDDLCAQFAQVLHEVVDERVVVVHDQDALGRHLVFLGETTPAAVPDPTVVDVEVVVLEVVVEGAVVVVVEGAVVVVVEGAVVVVVGCGPFET